MDIQQKYQALQKRIFVERNLDRLSKKYGNAPIPLDEVLTLQARCRKIIKGDDPLFPSYKNLQSTGALLKTKELSDILKDDELGLWSLDKNTIERLWSILLKERPSMIIECGAGISTIILSVYASIYSTQDNMIRIYSIEQDSNVKSSIEKRLSDLGLSKYSNILHAPISENGVYNLNQEIIDIMEKGLLKADLLLIDGPSGPAGCRYWTLVQLARYCKKDAILLLDDALRDGELEVLERWSKLNGVSIDGVYPVGKGLARGTIFGPGEITG